VIRFDRHQLGPRVFVLGRRVHEWHLGVALLVAALLTWVAGLWLEPLVVLVLVGCWLLVKDWHDLFPSRRDRAAWQFGLHRRVGALRTIRRSDSLPALCGFVALAVGLANLFSAVMPGVSISGHALLRTDALQFVPVSHALALPIAAGLIVCAPYLLRRRRRAWQFALVTLVGLIALSLAKGPDYAEVGVELVALVVVWRGQSAFCVRHNPVTLRSALWRLPLLWLSAGLLALILVWIAAPPRASMRAIVAETAHLLVWLPASFPYHDDVGRFPLGIGLIGTAVLMASAYLVFRPLAAPRHLPDARLRAAAVEIVRDHGSDTLAFFKLRHDQQCLFSPDRRAFLSYRVENGVMLISGDPVGATEALPGLLAQACSFAELRGLKLAATGVSESCLPLWQQAQLRPLYIGDEAIVDTNSFSLEGRAIRKVRQSVSRLENAGYRAELLDFSALPEATLGQLEAVSAAWRQGAPERGFSMAMDTLRNDAQQDTLVVIARDGAGAIRGFLHFVPTYGRAAVSLSFMRRQLDTPNGLNEFLVACSLKLLRERGIDEVSLNFAAFARLLHSPSSNLERLLGRLIALGNPFFQIESLYRFNAKFFPRWEPRYFVCEGTLGLPRAGLAALWAEGLIPKPKLPHRPPGQHAPRASR
jgi:lysyl-tRNA synthetase, class II